MSDTPETLAAILAEMREAGRSDEHADGPLIEDYADRIEAAAKRERVEREFAHKKVEESAPGNAAAMRAVIEELAAIHDVDDEWSCDGQNLLAFAFQARAALNHTKGE